MLSEEKETEATWEQVSDLLKPRKDTVHAGGLVIPFTYRDLTGVEVNELRAKIAVESGIDNKLMFQAFLSEATKLRVQSIAGHELGEGEWDTMVSADVQSQIVWTLYPQEMGLATAPEAFIKKWAADVEACNDTSAENETQA
ncbi:MAG: hypothetical protein DRI61_16145 [Chloroflexi bacterium]|nr:MAG: hypothetical protein DRI61_16145 [Chloroflexota bacterium]